MVLAHAERNQYQLSIYCMMTARLKAVGNRPDDNDAFINDVTNGESRLLQAFSSQVGIGSSHDCLSGICWMCLSTSASETGSNADRRTRLSVLRRNAGSGAHYVARRTFCTLSMKNDAQSVARSDMLIGDLSARLRTESIVCHRRLASLLLHFASCDRQKCLRLCSVT